MFNVLVEGERFSSDNFLEDFVISVRKSLVKSGSYYHKYMSFICIRTRIHNFFVTSCQQKFKI